MECRFHLLQQQHSAEVQHSQLCCKHHNFLLNFAPRYVPANAAEGPCG
jgi:hypothetical protein